MAQSLLRPSPDDKTALGSPKIVNISAKLATRRGNRKV
jgi:hypothetical protein